MVLLYLIAGCSAGAVGVMVNHLILGWGIEASGMVFGLFGVCGVIVAALLKLIFVVSWPAQRASHDMPPVAWPGVSVSLQNAPAGERLFASRLVARSQASAEQLMAQAEIAPYRPS